MDAELREYLESFRLEMLGRFSQVDDRFDQVDARLDQMDDRFDQVDARLDQMDDRFDQVDARLDQMDDRFDQVDARLDQMDDRFDQVDARFSQVDDRFDQVDARFSQMDDRFDQVDARFSQMDDRFDQVDARITEEIAALREEMVVGHEALHKEIRGVDRGLRLLIEDVRKDIRAVLDGVATANEKLDRRLEEYKHDTDNRTGLVEAVVQRHSGQIQDHDRRITVLEEQGGR